MPINLGWYPTARYTTWPNRDDIDWLLKDIDVLWVYETPLNYELFTEAKKRGIKIILYLNYEFLDYLQQIGLPKPDLFICPTSWGYERAKKLGPTIVLRQPVEIKDKRKIIKMTRFVHVAGRPAVHDRNGTRTFIEFALASPQYSYRLYIQPTEPIKELYRTVEHLDFEIIQNPRQEQLYETGDAMVLPRRYGGLCLPMLESLAVGMPVVMPRIVPNNDLLPKEWLSPANKISEFQARTTIDIHETTIKDLTSTIENIPARKSNHQAYRIAQKHSWENLKPLYLETIENVCLL